MQDWDDLRVLLWAVRCGSFVEAARRLGVNETTVARRVGRIEHRLGGRILIRRAGRLETTDLGDRLLPSLESAEGLIERGWSAATGARERVAGRVHVSAVPVLANRLLAPALPALLDAHPEIEIDLQAEARNQSVRRREVDIAMRLGRPDGEMAMLARRIGFLDYAAYRNRRRRDETSDFRWILYADAFAHLPQNRWMERRIAAGEGRPHRSRVSDSETALRLVAAGLGVSALPVFLGDGHADLTRLDLDAWPPAREVWLITHPDQRDSPRLRAATDWLTACVRHAAERPGGSAA